MTVDGLRSAAREEGQSGLLEGAVLLVSLGGHTRANQALLWNTFAKRGLGTFAAADDTNDFDPTPSFESAHADNATVTFKAVGQADGHAVQLFVGRYEVAASLSSPLALLHAIERLAPDVIVIDTESPSRDVLEHIVVMSQHTPRPVVMFATDSTPETIRDAVRAGVSAYVVDGLDRNRIKAIVDVAVARFEDFQNLREQLAAANLKLTERKLVERAKGLLMKSRSLDEDAAYALLRKFAMDRKLKLAEVARQLIDAADLLGA